MRPKNIRAWVWLTAICASAIGLAAARATDPPVRAEYLNTRDGKPTMRTYAVRLTLENPHDKPVWFVLPYWGDEPLPANGVFANGSGKDRPFGGKQFDGDGGAVVEVVMYGGKGFKAFRLPAKGKVVLDGYGVEAFTDVTDIVVQEAKELKVNGKTPLEKWLPYATTSGETVKVGRNAVLSDWKNLDWDAMKLKERDDYPKDKVEEVRAEGIKSWPVNIRPKNEKKDRKPER